MKSLFKIAILLLTVILFSCNGNKFKYKIEGNVMAKRHKSYLQPAVAYTDTIHGFNKDSIWYYNSDGSKLTLLAPYKIYKVKK